MDLHFIRGFCIFIFKYKAKLGVIIKNAADFLFHFHFFFHFGLLGAFKNNGFLAAKRHHYVVCQKFHFGDNHVFIGVLAYNIVNLVLPYRIKIKKCNGGRGMVLFRPV